jgi:1-deoxy-D-xylulose-5-phosphate synthase
MNRVYMKWKRETKDFFVESSLFEKFGLRYLGPVDGHDFDALQKNLEFAKHCDVPVLIHVLTKKGKGLEAAVAHPEKFHGASPFDPPPAKAKASVPARRPTIRTCSASRWPRVLPKANPNIVGITGAMPSGTGLSHLADRRARASSSTSASPRSTRCSSPPASPPRASVRCARSTRRFLQRAYDQSSTTSRCRTCR